jgi:cell division protein FtsL
MKDEENKINDFIRDDEPESLKENSILRSLVDGTLLTRKNVLSQMPFVIFLVMLSLLYISNRYHAESLRNKQEVYREEINELRSQAVYISSELMKLSRQTEVAKVVEDKGLRLKESIEPPKKIIKTKPKKRKKGVD